MVCTIEYINNWLKANLTQERYEHSLGTAECAEYLAKKYGINPQKAYFAGLIHDCAKCLPNNEMQNIIENFVTLECGESENPKTHHAPAGVYIAKTQFGVEDEEILSAIRWHTIGKIDMTMLEKIVFLADKIEERTRPKECTELKHLLNEENGLDKAILVCYKNTIKSLVDRELTICTQTIDIYNSLLKK